MPSGSDVILVIVVVTALAFDFTNGFHDTANAIATSVSTRAMSPRAAVAMAAVLNFAGAFISLQVAATVGSRIIKMDPAQGFSAQGAGAAVVLTASHLGFPLSTTHVISGGVMGAGAAKRLSAVRWGLAGNIAIAWVLTLPAAAVIGALVYAISSAFGSGALGPLVVALALLVLLIVVFA